MDGYDYKFNDPKELQKEDLEDKLKVTAANVILLSDYKRSNRLNIDGLFVLYEDEFDKAYPEIDYDVFEEHELIKAKDKSKLVPKTIIDKIGRKRVVWVKPVELPKHIEGLSGMAVSSAYQKHIHNTKVKRMSREASLEFIGRHYGKIVADELRTYLDNNVPIKRGKDNKGQSYEMVGGHTPLTQKIVGRIDKAINNLHKEIENTSDAHRKSRCSDAINRLNAFKSGLEHFASIKRENYADRGSFEWARFQAYPWTGKTDGQLVGGYDLSRAIGTIHDDIYAPELVGEILKSASSRPQVVMSSYDGNLRMKIISTWKEGKEGVVTIDDRSKYNSGGHVILEAYDGREGKHSEGQHKQIKVTINAIQNMISVKEHSSPMRISSFHYNRRGRAFHRGDEYSSQINTFSGDRHSVISHEIGHAVETKYKDINLAAKRVRLELAHKDYKGDAITYFNENETSNKQFIRGEYPSDYCGRIYPNGTTEIVSVFFEEILHSPWNYTSKKGAKKIFIELINAMQGEKS